MIYFDNASTTFPKPECVYVSMDTYNRTHGTSASRGQYKGASVANNLIKETRTNVKGILGCNTEYETVLTSTATEAINVVLQGLDYTNIKTIYITPFEHNAVLRTLYFLQNYSKFDIIELIVDKEPLQYDLSSIKKQFEEISPDLIIMTHASNVCGLITPIEAISSIARKYHPLVIVDMAQTAGLVKSNLQSTGVDVAVFAGHKTLYGPFGASGFVVKKGTPLTPLIYGGTGRDSASTSMPDEAPERFEAGTRNVQAIAGLNESLKWVADTGIKSIYDKEQNLKAQLIATLTEYKNIKIIETHESVGIVSCNFHGYSPDEIGNVLDSADIAVRTGLHCAPLAHKYLGTFPAGTIRFSLGYFNSTNDIEALNEVLKYIQENG